MRLNQNPFYTLNVSYKANRREIANAVDDMSLFFDASACANAQKELTTPSRRINAELGWFLTDNLDKIGKIRYAISNSTEIPADDVDSVSKLNAIVHNFEISSENDPIEIGYAIFNISEIFESINPDLTMEKINIERKESGFSEADINEVKCALSNRKDEIVQIISSKLGTISDDEYVDLINMLSERASEFNSFGAVLINVINQYELRMQPQLEKLSQSIKAQIKSIEAVNENDSIEKTLRILIDDVKNWDHFAQPIQLLSHNSGIPHQNSENIGHSLRNLAVFLHNEQGRTKEALSLVNEMKSVFAELDGLLEVFENDSSTLEKLIKGDEETKEIITLMEKLESLANSVKRFPSESMTSNYISTIKEASTKIKHSNIDYDTKKQLRKNIAYKARSVAVDIHNNNHDTANALKIVNALIVEFCDIYDISSKLEEDKKLLNLELIRSLSSGARTSGYSSTKKAGEGSFSLFKTILVIAIVIIIAVALINSCSNSSSTSTTQTQTQTQAQTQAATTEASFYGSPDLSKQPQINYSQGESQKLRELDTLEKEILELESSLISLKSTITSQENRLTSIGNKLDEYESSYYSTGDEYYADQFNYFAKEYDNLYQSYDSNITIYNSKLQAYETKVNKYNSIVDELNK